MAAPTRYELAYDFTSFQTSNPTTPLPADKIEIEFNALQTTTDEIITNLNLIQRSDGALANNSVGNDQLKSEVTIGVNAATDWATSTAYAANDTVYQNNKVYRCLVAHTSGTFATDLTAVKWVEILDFDQFITADQTFSLRWQYDNTTIMSAPASGDVRFNNSTLSSVTQIAINAGANFSGYPDVSDYITTWDDGGISIRGTLIIRAQNNPAFFLVFNIESDITDNTTWLQIPVTYVTGSGSISDDDELYFQYIRSSTGLYINVLENGVVGDGVTDDTAAINALIGTAGSYFFPRTANGYLISSEILPASNVGIYGAAGSKIFSTDETHSMVRLSSVDNVVFDGLEIANDAPQYDNDGTNSDRGSGFRDNSIASPSTRIVIRNCYLHDIAYFGILNEGGNYWTVQNNRVVQTGRDGIHLNGGTGHIVSGNRVIDNGDDGIVIADDCYSATVMNNFCKGNGSYNISGAGIRCNAKRSTIVGNTIIDPTIFGIILADLNADPTDNPDYTVVANNTIYGIKPNANNQTTAGIGIKNVETVLITGNMVDVIGDNSHAISGCADNGSGLVRVTFSAAHSFSTGNFIRNSGIVGTTEANGRFEVTVIDSTTIDLVGSSFSNAYVSGGTAIHSTRAFRCYSTDDHSDNVIVRNNVVKGAETLFYLLQDGVERLQVEDNYFENYQRGLDYQGTVDKAADIIFKNNHYHNGISAPILFLGNSTGANPIGKLIVEGNRITSGGSTCCQFVSKTVDYCRMINNDFGSVLEYSSASNVTAFYFDGDKNDIQINQGTATLANGTTTIEVAHNLTNTPNADEIHVRPIETLGSASFWWIDTIDGNSFNIRVNANPGADVDFAWRIEEGIRKIN